MYVMFAQRLTCKNVRSVINSTPGAFQGCGRGAILLMVYCFVLFKYDMIRNHNNNTFYKQKQVCKRLHQFILVEK